MLARQSYENAVTIAMSMLKSLFFALIVLNFAAAHAATLRVGPGQPFKTPSHAAQEADDGDTIEIEAGLYDGDTAIWWRHNLTIRGIGGRAHIQAGEELAMDKAIWVIKGRNTTIENIEFSGARVEDRNGAGIRMEGQGLTVRNCYFHHNENGILTDHNPDSDIVVEHSEFFANGHGDGYSHNLYIGEVNSFTLRFSYSYGADIGHQVKSRAKTNYILYNRLMDEADGASSYIIDLPNGGLSFVIGNLIQQGPKAENSTMLSYGAEGRLRENSRLYVVNNTFVNDRHAGNFIRIAPKLADNLVMNNLFAGRGKLVGEAKYVANIETEKPGFVSARTYDYRLLKNSPAVDAGKDPGAADGFELLPSNHYIHPLQTGPRTIANNPDAGAYELMR